MVIFHKKTSSMIETENTTDVCIRYIMREAVSLSNFMLFYIILAGIPGFAQVNDNMKHD